MRTFQKDGVFCWSYLLEASSLSLILLGQEMCENFDRSKRVRAFTLQKKKYFVLPKNYFIYFRYIIILRLMHYFLTNYTIYIYIYIVNVEIYFLDITLVKCKNLNNVSFLGVGVIVRIWCYNKCKVDKIIKMHFRAPDENAQSCLINNV